MPMYAEDDTKAMLPPIQYALGGGFDGEEHKESFREGDEDALSA